MERISSEYTPTLLNILEAVFSSKPIPLAKIQPTICMVAAILSKFMNPTMNLVQSYISILLHAGHCSKQVCLSFTASLGIIGVTAFFLIHHLGIPSATKAHDMYVFRVYYEID